MHKQLLTGLTPIATAFAVVGLGTYVEQAQAAPAPMFENVTIGPKFSPDPIEIGGISGGNVPAKTIAGTSETPNGPCVGFVDEKPDHTLVLTDSFNYLKLLVQSPDDTTLVVRGPGGTWCNDDSEGKNPAIVGQWLPGTYSIWVGSSDQNQYRSYTLRITEIR